MGCGTRSDNTSSAEKTNGDDFQTVSISHALGTAEITTRPERIVTLGQGSAETVIALGKTPVATEKYEWGADESGYLPWVKQAVEEQGGNLPELITGGEEIRAEEIAAFEPDLILAPWSGITQQQYDQISAIAPTVAYPEKPWTINWEDQISTIATALGEKDKATDIINGIESNFAKIRSDHPDFQNYNFAYIYNSGQPENLGVFLPDEQRSKFVQKLGFQVAPFVEEMKKHEVEGTDSARFSAEEAFRLNDVDIIFTFYIDENNRQEMHDNPIYGAVKPIKKGAEVAPTDRSLVTASSMLNPLTVPWALERFLPMIEPAVQAASKG